MMDFNKKIIKFTCFMRRVTNYIGALFQILLRGDKIFSLDIVTKTLVIPDNLST